MPSIDEKTGITGKFAGILDKPKVGYGVALLGLAALYAISRVNFLLFHTLAEFFGIMVACCIFMISWNTRKFTSNSYLMVLGISYLFVGALDLLHTFAFPGMGIFNASDTNRSVQLWVIARYFEAGSLMASFLFLRRKANQNLVFVAMLLTAVAAASLVFYFKIFPTCFIEGQGLTPFKVTSEYVVVGGFALSLFLMRRHRNLFGDKTYRFLRIALVTAIAQDLSFTLYQDTAGLFFALGHYLKVISYFMIYKAILETGIRTPYHLLATELDEKHDALAREREALKDSLEQLERLKASETEKEKLYSQLVQAGKLASIGTLGAGVAHELCNPLAVIRCYVQILDEMPPPPHEIQTIAGKMLKMCDRMQAIIDHLRRFSRQSTMDDWKQIDIHAPIKDSLILLEQQLTLHQIRVTMDLHQGECIILGDHNQLESIFQNLIINSRDAFHTVRDDRKKMIRIASRILDDEVEVTFEDNAGGIPKGIQNRVFDPFFTTKEVGKGTGLGLSITHDITAKHHGHVKLESSEGQGTKFVFRFPLSQDSQLKKAS